MPNKKYFLAIVIPEPLFTKVEEVKHSLLESHGLKGALRSPAHITLHRPFEWKEEKEKLLIEKLGEFKNSGKFFVELKGFAFFEPRVIYVNVVGNESISLLHNELARFAQKELKLLNEINDLRGFHPHVTVAFRDLKKPLFYTLQSEFRGKEFVGTFDYKGFSLLKLEKTWEVLCDFPT
ncbi:MAG: 2'-5' RNA ligase family protein [bacterium]|nr:2'-5' RNA ligase family protein [bacterium]